MTYFKFLPAKKKEKIGTLTSCTLKLGKKSLKFLNGKSSESNPTRLLSFLGWFLSHASEELQVQTSVDSSFSNLSPHPSFIKYLLLSVFNSLDMFSTLLSFSLTGKVEYLFNS